MKQADISSILNRVVVMHGRALPVYLNDATPWTSGGTEDAQAALKSIAADQLFTVNRLADYIQSLGGAVNLGSFPMHYAGWNDLSLSFLTSKATQNQAREIAELEFLLPQLDADPKAKALVEEALGAAKAHLDTLADLNGVAS
jgi:hypothetical protein